VFEFELDSPFQVSRAMASSALLGGFHQDVAAFPSRFSRWPALRALTQAFECHPVGGGASGGTPGVAVGTSTKLEHEFVAEKSATQGRHVPGRGLPPEGHGEDAGGIEPSPGRKRKLPRLLSFRDEGFTQLVNEGPGWSNGALQACHHRAGGKLSHRERAQALGRAAGSGCRAWVTVRFTRAWHG